MAKSGVLRELENHQRPPRRLDKIYGRKNKLKALSSAMHFDLFGGGDENSIVEKMDKLTVQSDTVTAEKPVKETSTPVRESPTEKSVKETSTPIQKQPTVQNPRRRLRRQKSILSEIMSVSHHHSHPRRALNADIHFRVLRKKNSNNSDLSSHWPNRRKSEILRNTAQTWTANSYARSSVKADMARFSKSNPKIRTV